MASTNPTDQRPFAPRVEGQMSEFEATLIRSVVEAIQQKARRGELWIPFLWVLLDSTGRIEKHPDQRVQQAIQLVLENVGAREHATGLIWLRQHTCACLYVLPMAVSWIVWKLPGIRTFSHPDNPFMRVLTRSARLKREPGCGWPRGKRSGFRKPRHNGPS